MADQILNSGFMHMAAGLSVGFTGLAAGYAIGIVGDAVRPFSIIRSICSLQSREGFGIVLMRSRVFDHTCCSQGYSLGWY